MNTDKLKDVINFILKNKGAEPLRELRTDMHLRNEIGFDSFDLAELTVRVEEEFGKDIFEDGLVNTVGEVLKKLQE